MFERLLSQALPKGVLGSVNIHILHDYRIQNVLLFVTHFVVVSSFS